MKTAIKILAILAIGVIVGWILKPCGGDPESNTTSDTSTTQDLTPIIDSITDAEPVKETKPDKPNTVIEYITELIPDSAKTKQLLTYIDSLQTIINDYEIIRTYSDTTRNDSDLTSWYKLVMQYNRQQSIVFGYIINRPTQIINNTTVNNYNHTELFIIGGLSVSNESLLFGGDLELKKRKVMYRIGYRRDMVNKKNYINTGIGILLWSK